MGGSSLKKKDGEFIMRMTALITGILMEGGAHRKSWEQVPSRIRTPTTKQSISSDL